MQHPVFMAWLTSMTAVLIVYRQEEKIALPRPPNPGSNVSFSATVDALVFTNISQDMWREIRKAAPTRPGQLGRDLRLRFHGNATQIFYVGLFPLECKCHDAAQMQRQLTMYLTAIQYHRRILCFADRLVYGATFREGVFTLYVASWDTKNRLVSSSISINCASFMLRAAHLSRFVRL